jgi:hypothetical protein
VAELTICLTYYQSLTLENLSASLFSVRLQDLSYVTEIIILDNNTPNSAEDIQQLIDSLAFPVPVRLLSFKHGDPNKTHAWSTNTTITNVSTSWVLFTRADYLLDPSHLRKCLSIITDHPENWDGFVVSNGRHLHADITACEQASWRMNPDALQALPGADFDYTIIDSGVWFSRRSAFDRVNGLDEALSSWGHAQTDFQHRLFKTGTEFVRIPEVLYFHPMHAASRDIIKAHDQLQARGVDLKVIWSRYHGVNPY